MELTGNTWFNLHVQLDYAAMDIRLIFIFFNYNPKIRKFECNARCLNNCDGEDKQTCLECDSAD